MKRWIAAILMLVMLTHALPTDALAATGTVLSDEELQRAYALVGRGENAPQYHEGMRASAKMTAWQMWSCLNELLDGDIYSVCHTLARADMALADLERDDEGAWQQLAGTGDGKKLADRVRQLQLEAEDLRQTMVFQQSRLHEHIAMVEQTGSLLESEMNYSFERVRYSERIRHACSEIDAIRQFVAANYGDWLTQIDQWQDICEGSLEGEGSPDAGVGDWLSELFLAAEAPISTQVTLSVFDASHSRMNRLSQGGSVLAGTDDASATLTVISQNQIAIQLLDSGGKQVTGVKIGARDANSTDDKTVYSDTGVFDICSFKVDEDGEMELFIEANAGDSGFQSFCIPNVNIKRGSIFTKYMKEDDGKPYIYLASFHGRDILYNEMKMVYSKINDQAFNFVVKVQRHQDAPAPVLCYTNANGTETQVRGVDQGNGEYSFSDKWKQILSPNVAKKIFFRLGAEGAEVDTLLKPVASVFDKPTDITNTFSLFTEGIGLSFKVPAVNWVVSVGLKLTDFMPKLSVDPTGSVVLTIGASSLSKEIEDTYASWKDKETQDYDKLTKHVERDYKQATENFDKLADELEQRKKPWMVKGGITFGLFWVSQGRWQRDGDETNWSLTGAFGGNVTIFGDFTYTFAAGPLPCFVNITVSGTLSAGLSTQVDFRMVQGRFRNFRWEFLHDFTLAFRIGLGLSVGAGVKGVAAIWINGSLYFNFALSIALEKPVTFEISFGGSVSLGAQLLFVTFNVVLVSNKKPIILYRVPKDAYSLLDTYMGALRPAGGEDQPKTAQPHEPETYPALRPKQASMLEALENTLDDIRVETLDGDAFAFFIQDRRVHWINLSKNVSGSIDDCIPECTRLYGNDVPLSELTDYAFDVRVASGTRYNQFGEKTDDLNGFFALAALSAKAFEEDGCPVENPENAAVYTLMLWRDPLTGALVPGMNGDARELSCYRIEWVGRDDSIPFMPDRPQILQATYTYRLIRNTMGDHPFSMKTDGSVDVRLTEAVRIDGAGSRKSGDILLGQALKTFLDSDSKPIKDSFQNLQNNKAVRSDDDIASGAGSDYRRVASASVDDQCWIAVSRSENGEGRRGAVELYDWSMDAAGEGRKRTIKLVEGEISEETLRLLGDGQSGYWYFYTDDVEPDEQANAYRLKGLYLKPGKRGSNGDLRFSVTDTSYDIVLPTNRFKAAVLGVQYVLYWLSTGTVDEDGHALNRICFAVFDPATNTMSDSFVFAEFSLGDDDLAVRDVDLAGNGKWYMVVSKAPAAQSNGGDAAQERQPLSLYTLSEALAPVLEFQDLALADLMVCPGDFDNFSTSIMNAGNVAATEMDIEMVVKDADGSNEMIFQTLHADLLNPEKSSLTMGDAQIMTGEKAFYRTEDYDFAPKQRDFVLSEVTTDYVVEGGVLKSAEKGEPEAQYLMTKAMMPGALASFKGVFKIPSDWAGEKTIELRVKKEETSAGWVGLIASAAGRDSAVGTGDTAGYETITYERDPDTGVMALREPDLPTAQTQLFAQSTADARTAKVTSMHDLEVHGHIYPGPNGEKMLSISVMDLAHTGERIRLYAEIYVDDSEEPLHMNLDHYPDAMSDNVTHNYDMRLSTLVDPSAYQKARVVIRGVDIEETALSNNEFTLYLDGDPDPLTILRQPRDVTIQAGESASFEVQATGGIQPYSYQWQMWDAKHGKWVDISGATDPVLSRDNVEREWSGAQFHCVVTDRAETTVISEAATLTIRDSVDTGDHSSLPLYLSVAAVALALLWLLRRRTGRAK